MTKNGYYEDIEIMDLPILALVLPCYNEEALAKKSCEILLNFLNKLIEDNIISDKSYISVVDDGSTDKSWEILNTIASEEKKLKLIRFICNFGHQKALFAGMTENDADIYITLYFDLQDDLDVIPEMIEKYKNKNVDIVYGVRNNRDVDPIIKKILAKLYYKLSAFLGIKQMPQCADFRLVTNKVVNFLRNSKETNIYLRGLLYSLNFSYDKVYYRRKERLSGVPKYTFVKLYELAMDGITSSNNTIRLINIPAVLFLLIAIFTRNEVFFVGSINLFAIVLIGEYITKIYTESKNRPSYILSEKINYE